jgi:hypothetical protein
MRRRSKALVALLIAIALGITAGGVTYAAFVATGTNSGNRIESGSVKIGDNDGGSAMFSLTGMLPGSTDSGCIKVTYDGSLTSSVRLHGATTGSGLDRYIDLKVTRGVNSPSDPAFDGCGNFQADGTDYINKGNGVVYDGTLRNFPDDYANGLVDPTLGSPESWTVNESHSYRFQVTLQSDVGAEGKNATQVFTWEARNE